MALPTYPGWIPDNTTNISTPPGGKLTIGWIAEKPPYQYFNWFFNLVSQWLNRLGPNAPTVVVGSAAYCTHATLAAAVADAGVGTNINVLLTESATISSIVHLTKAGWRISALPGVTYTKSVVASCLSVEAANVWITGLRFSGWTGGSDHAITGTSAWQYGKVLFCSFTVGTNDDIDTSSCTAGKIPVTLGNVDEV